MKEKKESCECYIALKSGINIRNKINIGNFLILKCLEYLGYPGVLNDFTSVCIN